MKPMPTVERLNELFELRDGVLYWKKVTSNRAKVGDSVGTVFNNGYLNCCVDKNKVSNHRIIYKMVHGVEPEFIDHIDGNKLNNDPNNLRSVTMQQNNWNMASKPSKSGVKGVYFDARRDYWVARIKRATGKTHLGAFATKDLAKEFVELAREMLHGEYANHKGAVK
jgi:hypothetical protein